MYRDAHQTVTGFEDMERYFEMMREQIENVNKNVKILMEAKQKEVPSAAQDQKETGKFNDQNLDNQKNDSNIGSVIEDDVLIRTIRTIKGKIISSDAIFQ